VDGDRRRHALTEAKLAMIANEMMAASRRRRLIGHELRRHAQQPSFYPASAEFIERHAPHRRRYGNDHSPHNLKQVADAILHLADKWRRRQRGFFSS